MTETSKSLPASIVPVRGSTVNHVSGRPGKANTVTSRPPSKSPTNAVAPVVLSTTRKLPSNPPPYAAQNITSVSGSQAILCA